jgi:hypothetical protein
MSDNYCQGKTLEIDFAFVERRTTGERGVPECGDLQRPLARNHQPKAQIRVKQEIGQAKGVGIDERENQTGKRPLSVH